MVQIDMKMPNNCMVCPLLSYIPHENGDDEPVCYYTGDDLPEGYFHHDGGRPEFCPLKEARDVELVMPDREKVISTLEEIKTQAAGIGLDSAVISHKFIDKIITMLKEQETVKPKIDAFGHPYCPKCKILVYETWEFCPHCGQAVKWE